MRRLPLALLPLLLPLLLLPLLLPLLLSLGEGDTRVPIMDGKMTERGHSQAKFSFRHRGHSHKEFSQSGGSFSRKLPRRCVSPPSDATTAWQCFVWY